MVVYVFAPAPAPVPVWPLLLAPGPGTGTTDPLAVTLAEPLAVPLPEALDVELAEPLAVEPADALGCVEKVSCALDNTERAFVVEEAGDVVEEASDVLAEADGVMVTVLTVTMGLRRISGVSKPFICAVRQTNRQSLTQLWNRARQAPGWQM